MTPQPPQRSATDNPSTVLILGARGRLGLAAAQNEFHPDPAAS